ncbi:hypothetical protein CIW52_11110 [Mycolicibacterium sp. P9-64]|uniref:hypothetical protein n=1 Tax=Mycolicibacterium sp. P9-64 TaxID=2024612 RepID=UPI001252B858|nr:hypothetical protein [Mycolicibacterium sp. P9-64]KAA0084542.1 hypothetical protein CIW52_11110 [Mycolicibacterium sp. P9-64]
MTSNDAWEDDVALRAGLLRRAYEGEIIGCAMYREMMSASNHPNSRALQLLYSIERVTADALKPMITRYEIAVAEDASVTEGIELGKRLVGRSWDDMWRETIRLAEDYLDDFNRLSEVLKSEDIALGVQVVEHEEALIAFARREIDGDPDATAPLEDYLRRYPPSAGSINANQESTRN